MDREAINQEFQDKVKNCTRQAACGRPFVLVGKLQDWLRSPVKPGEKVTHAERLLDNAFYSRKLRLPISSDQFQPGDNCCLLVFCILQRIGCGAAISHFSRCGNVDKLLPLRRDTVEDMFEKAKILDENLRSSFFEQQYLFCPARFDLRRTQDWGDKRLRVVPICARNLITSKGGTAKLYQIAVPEEYVGSTLRDLCSGSRFNASSKDEDEPEWRYQFALKTFHGTYHHLYQNEMSALRGLQDHEGMVRWLTDYTLTQSPLETGGQTISSPTVQVPEVTTHNILLEYGQMDLSVYFAEMEPPVRSSDIETFWRSLFAVAEAVKGIHNLKVQEAGSEKEYHGWHTDIKPDNILYLEDRLRIDRSLKSHRGIAPEHRERAFKLADPGFAKFQLKTHTHPQAVPAMILQGGTVSYGAPEYPGQSELPVPQTIDIWSLGCVFSLAATWVILGYRGLCQFQELRRRAPEDCFHDGKQVLGDVTKWHQFLRTAIRRTDTLTDKVLDVVDGEMLVGATKQRITATNLCSELDRVLQSASRNHTDQLSNTTRTVLSDYERTSEVSNLRFDSLERAPPTTFRPSLRPQQNLGTQNNEITEQDSLNRDASSHPSFSYPQTPPRAKDFNKHSRVLSDLTIRTNTISQGRKGVMKSHPPMNIFQARQKIENRKKAKWKPLSRRSRQDEFKDGLLTSYFRGTRDIIFLVDNAESMLDHWYEATLLLKTLVETAEGLDENGMDLHFTTGTTKLEGKDSAEKFVDSMRKARPKEGTHTDLRSSLGDILEDYKDKLTRKAKYSSTAKVKDLVLVILTDGIWAGMAEKNDIADQLVRFSQTVKSFNGDLKQRPVGVEFIQFGTDEAATQEFKHLDDFLDGAGIPDFIDTEHSSGDINKMLLGSFVEEYDKDEGDEGEHFGSPINGAPYTYHNIDEDVGIPELGNGPTRQNTRILAPSQFSSPPRRNDRG